jgi:hypothetical protein
VKISYVRGDGVVEGVRSCPERSLSGRKISAGVEVVEATHSGDSELDGLGSDLEVLFGWIASLEANVVQEVGFLQPGQIFVSTPWPPPEIEKAVSVTSQRLQRQATGGLSIEEIVYL